MPGPLTDSRHRLARARFAVLTSAVFGLLAFAGCDVSEDADVERGRSLFLSKCGTCHALAQAGTTVDIGPDLDAAFARSRVDGMDNDTIEGVVQLQIAHPREPNVPEDSPIYSEVYMPADLVTGQDAEDVATYVASVAGVPGAKAPQLAPAELFTEQCGICHALAAAGTAGNTGPNLDEALAGKDAKYVEQQIVDPNSEIAQGFPPNVMPQSYEQTLSADDLQGLVDYLLQNVAK